MIDFSLDIYLLVQLTLDLMLNAYPIYPDHFWYVDIYTDNRQYTVSYTCSIHLHFCALILSSIGPGLPYMTYTQDNPFSPSGGS